MDAIYGILGAIAVDTVLIFVTIIAVMALAFFAVITIEQWVFLKHLERKNVQPTHRDTYLGQDATALLEGARVWDVGENTVLFCTKRFDLVEYHERHATLSVLDAEARLSGIYRAVVVIPVTPGARRRIDAYRDEVNALRGKYGYKA